MTREEPEPLGHQQRAMRAALWALAVAAVVAVLLWAYLRLRPLEPLGIGRELNALSLQPLTGDSAPVSLASLKNRVTLLNLWGPWCPPCRRELPHLAELSRHFASEKAFQLLAVAYPSEVSDDVESLRDDTAAVLSDLKVSIPTYRDDGKVSLSAVDGAIGFSGYPTTLLIDRKGVIRGIWVGDVSGIKIEVRQRIAEVLRE
ncbi:MAG: TlpA family protein disulfide reductase [Planctomycetaceae bacterium]|nr:TlpA family protein disulfide reductase [Planctomycetaceae bacterium]